MSAIQPVAAQVSSSVNFSAGGAAVGGPAGVGDVAAPTGALGVQTSLMLQSANGLSNVENLAALALALLLNKGNESKQNDDPWKALAALAFLGAFGGQQQTSFALSQSVTAAGAGMCAGAAASGGNLNLQG